VNIDDPTPPELAAMGLRDVTAAHRDGIGPIAGATDPNGNPVGRPPAANEDDFDAGVLAAGQRWYDPAGELLPMGHDVRLEDVLDPTDTKPARWRCTQQGPGASGQEVELVPRAFARLSRVPPPPPPLAGSPFAALDLAVSTLDVEGAEAVRTEIERLKTKLSPDRWEQLHLQASFAAAMAGAETIGGGLRAAWIQMSGGDPVTALGLTKNLQVGFQAVAEALNAIASRLTNISIARLRPDSRLVLVAIADVSGEAGSWLNMAQTRREVLRVCGSKFRADDVLGQYLEQLAALGLIEAREGSNGAQGASHGWSFRVTPRGRSIAHTG